MAGDIISLPGKLRARPVQHPATPALITAGKDIDYNINPEIIKMKCILQLMPYHHPSLATSLRSRQPNCVLQTKLQTSNKEIYRCMRLL